MKLAVRVVLSLALLGALAGCAGMQPSGDSPDALTWLQYQDDLQQGGE